MDSIIPHNLIQRTFDFDALDIQPDQISPPKRCPKCKQCFPPTTDFFYKHKRDGLSSRCRTCTKADAMIGYTPHPMTDEKWQTQRAKMSESMRNSEKVRAANKRLADSRRGKSIVFSDPELHAANISKATKGKKHNVKPRVKFQQAAITPIHLDLPIFDGCEPKDYTEIDEVMSI